MVASSGIRADRRRPAGISKALVQIHTLGTDGFEAILAEALPFDALGIVDAIKIRLAQRRDVGLRTAQQGRRFTLFKFSSRPKTPRHCIRKWEPVSTVVAYLVDAQIRSTSRVKWSRESVLWLYKRRKECNFGKEINGVKPVRVSYLLRTTMSYIFFFSVNPVNHKTVKDIGDTASLFTRRLSRDTSRVMDLVSRTRRLLVLNGTGLLNYYLIASDCRIGAGTIARWTDAIVAGIRVLANRVPAARILQSRALVDV